MYKRYPSDCDGIATDSTTSYLFSLGITTNLRHLPYEDTLIELSNVKSCQMSGLKQIRSLYKRPRKIAAKTLIILNQHEVYICPTGNTGISLPYADALGELPNVKKCLCYFNCLGLSDVR